VVPAIGFFPSMYVQVYCISSSIISVAHCYANSGTFVHWYNREKNVITPAACTDTPTLSLICQLPKLTRPHYCKKARRLKKVGATVVKIKRMAESH